MFRTNLPSFPRIYGANFDFYYRLPEIKYFQQQEVSAIFAYLGSRLELLPIWTRERLARLAFTLLCAYWTRNCWHLCKSRVRVLSSGSNVLSHYRKPDTLSKAAIKPGVIVAVREIQAYSGRFSRVIKSTAVAQWGHLISRLANFAAGIWMDVGRGEKLCPKVA